MQRVVSSVVGVLVLLGVAVLAACGPVDRITDVAGRPGLHTQTVTSGKAVMTVYWRDTRSPVRGGVLLVHGGGWASGTRNRFTAQAQALADRGYVAATTDYRLADGSAARAWPAQVQDVLSAWRTLHARRGTYHLEPTRLALAGESAGGHLVLAAVQAMLPTERPSAVVSWSGPTDLVRWMTQPEPTCLGDECVHYRSLAPAITDKLLRCRLEACPARFTAASPARTVGAPLPPLLQTFYEREIVPDVQGRAMDAAQRAAGGPSTLRVYPGFGHGATWTPQVWTESVAFLEPYMGATSGSRTSTAVQQRATQRVPLSVLVGP